MNTPEISIVMPAYNSAKYLNESIDSILDQTFTNFELIIVDDGSTDNSIHIIKLYEDQRIVLICNPHDFIRSLNSGIAASKGKYIVRMDADDIMLPHRLEMQYNYMENNPTIDICGGWMEAFGGEPYIIRTLIGHDDIAVNFLDGNSMCHPTIIMRKESLQKYLPYPNIYKADFIYAEDYELWVALIMSNFKFANIPEVLVKYRLSENQNTSRFVSHMAKSSNKVLENYLGFIADQIITTDNSLFDFIDKAVKLQNDNEITFSSFRKIISDIYKNQLDAIRTKDKVKILFCIDTLTGGGAEKLLMDILKYFDYDKYCVDLLILTSQGVYFSDIPSHVNWFILNNRSYIKNTYDVEVAFLEGSATKFIGQRQTDARKIAWIHIDLFNFHWSKQFYIDGNEEKTCYSQMDKIISVSQGVESQFRKLYPEIKVAQYVIYNLIDIQIIRKKSVAFTVPTRKLTLCSIGRLAPQKGYTRLMPIINRLVREDRLSFEFWLVGEGGQRSELEALIHKYSLNDVVFLKGFQKNPYPYLKAADIFISSSSSEGYPLAVCEAIGLGKPVIATNITGSDEILENGKYGMLVELDDESIYNGLKEMIINQAFRQKYAELSLLRSEMFDIEKSMNQIYNALDYD